MRWHGLAWFRMAFGVEGGRRIIDGETVSRHSSDEAHDVIHIQEA